MRKEIKIFCSFIIIAFIFLILFKGLQKPNQYAPKDIVNKIDLNTSLKGFSENKNYSLDQLVKNDKYSLINIWSSWCSPCKDEHAYLMHLHNKNINLIGINYKDNKKNAKNFIEELGNPYKKILLDIDGTKSIELGAIGVPETYLFQKSSNSIVKRYIGPLDEEKIKEIKKIIFNE